MFSGLSNDSIRYSSAATLNGTAVISYHQRIKAVEGEIPEGAMSLDAPSVNGLWTAQESMKGRMVMARAIP